MSKKSSITAEITAARLTTERQIVQQLKLNHGLYLDGHGIRPSNEAIFSDDGRLEISLYKGEPIVYTNINDPTSSTNLFTFNNDVRDNMSEVSYLQTFDACINFPIAEFIYEGELLELFSKCKDKNDENLNLSYGHIFARKVMVGGKLFIKNSNLASSKQIDTIQTHLTGIYNFTKYNKENPFSNVDWCHLPRVETSNGQVITSKLILTNWMNNLYQKNMFDIISYNDIIPVFQLNPDIYDFDDFEIQPGVANFGKQLSFKRWAEHANLFLLFQGLTFNKFYKNYEVEVSKKIAFKFIDIPVIKPIKRSYLKFIKPATNLDEFFISNNIASVKDTSSFPFIKKYDKFNNLVNKDHIHLVVKCEQYEILIDHVHAKHTKEFEESIEIALKSIEPYKALQDTFDEFGHLFPQRIVLGRSFHSNLPNISSNSFNNVSLESLNSESLKSYLDHLNVSYLLTHAGEIIDIDNDAELSNLIQDTNSDLEIIEFDKIISTSDIIFRSNQYKDIAKLLNVQNDLKIIMTGITDLKDLDDNNVEHYKYVKIEPSLKDSDYEVFGSIVLGKKKLEECFISFGMYDLNGFTAIIKTSNFRITECHILWFIIGKPSKLSVFSPRNRSFEVVDLIKAQFLLKPDKSYYRINIENTTLHGNNYFFINSDYSTTNFGPNHIKIAGWESNAIDVKISNCNSIYDDVQIINSTYDESRLFKLDLNICILRSSLLKINNGGEEYSLDTIGHKMTFKNRNLDIKELKMIPFSNEELECSLVAIYGNRPEVSYVILSVPSKFTYRKYFKIRKLLKGGLLNTIRLISASEATAIHCMKTIRNENLLVKPLSQFLVVNCGGAMVELTIRQLLSDDTLAEKSLSSGGLCGSIYVDREFLEYITKKVGPDALKDLKNNHGGQLKFLVQQYQEIKHSFTGNKDDYNICEMNLEEICPDIKRYVAGTYKDDLERNKWIVKLFYDDVKQMFDPIIVQIIKLIHEQLNFSESCFTIFLVGGFSESKYLQKCIEQEFQHLVQNIFVPEKPIEAVLRGSFQYTSNLISTRVINMTYGIKQDGLFKRIVDIGTEVNEKQEFELELNPENEAEIYIEMYETTVKDPKFCDELGVNLFGTIKLGGPKVWYNQLFQSKLVFLFGQSEIRVYIKDQYGMYIKPDFEILD
ncbi:8949_t:CDS:2 [Funneliformis caledonium]|uniref:8949_t:CDS:1 n=1 Tax=Funneliformis caledonium TaxID=1117310 RepID=A0A9N9FDC4_9GLOM|nr:8949_t:CDS:2 [Funneliformis caledonium]